MKKRIVAIIPARGGSKGLERKNIRILAGKPMIVYTIEAAQSSKKISDFYVSTEDKEIKNVAKRYGAAVIERPKELAKDTTPMVDVLKHAVKYMERQGIIIDAVMLLQPTSPVRDTKDIDSAVSEFEKNKCDSLVSMCEVKCSPYWMKKIEMGKVLSFIKGKKEYTRRQDLPKVYQLNGSIYITRKNVLLKENKILGKNTIPFLMPEENSIDVDTELDFLTAEAVIKKRNAENKNI